MLHPYIYIFIYIYIYSTSSLWHSQTTYKLFNVIPSCKYARVHMLFATDVRLMPAVNTGDKSVCCLLWLVAICTVCYLHVKTLVCIDRCCCAFVFYRVGQQVSGWYLMLLCWLYQYLSCDRHTCSDVFYVY